MKSYKLWSAALPLVLALAACGGTSSIGSGDPTDTNEGGGDSEAGTTGMGAGATVGSGGKPSTGMGATTSGGMTTVGGGMPTPGTGATSGEGMCSSDVDCDTTPCQMCADGSTSCQKSYCAAGRCQVVPGPYCPIECANDVDCIDLGTSGVGCIDCGDGTQTCPTGSCLMGYCQINMQGCHATNPCANKACGAACSPCTTGDCGEAPAFCNRDGKCAAGMPSCAGGTACETAMDCGSPPPNCVECGDGTCAAFDCMANKCVFACPSTQPPECKVSEDCPTLGEMCKECSNGKCAVQACLQGSCELVCPFE